MNTQYHIVVSGKVQRVGFRDKVEDIALSLNLTGYVENSSHRKVIIVAEGEEQSLARFCDELQKCPPPILVSTLKITEHPYCGEFDDFIIIRGDPNDEFAERFDSAIFYLHTMNQKMDQSLGKQDQMLDKQDQMLDKQDQMLGKQDQMLDKQDRMLDKQDQMLHLQGKMLNKQDDMIVIQKHAVDLQSKTLDEVHSLRNDFSDRFMHEISEARAEIRQLRNELVQAGVLSSR